MVNESSWDVSFIISLRVPFLFLLHAPSYLFHFVWLPTLFKNNKYHNSSFSLSGDGAYAPPPPPLGLRPRTQSSGPKLRLATQDRRLPPKVRPIKRPENPCARGT